MTIIVSEGQSLLDVALWLLGGTEGLFPLADANGLAITDDVVAGQVLVVPEGAAVSADQVSYFQSQQIRVNTANIVRPVVPAPKRADFKLIDFKNSDFLN